MARRVLTKFLIPGATAVVATECADKKSCRRTDLPIYMPENKKEEHAKPVQEKKSKVECEQVEVGALEENIRMIRKSFTAVMSEISSAEEQGIKLLYDGVDQAQWVINYLGDNENPAPKIPAIAIGGLTGFILALRGGIFRKVVFTSAGALSMASICYPEEAREYSKVFVRETKTYATIAYNFIYGVKKGDPPLELPSLPKLPASVSEAWSMVNDLTKGDPTSVSEKHVEPKVTEELSDISTEEEEPLFIPDTEKIVSEIHDESTYTSCHCPIGACLKPRGGDDCPPVVPVDPNNPPIEIDEFKSTCSSD